MHNRVRWCNLITDEIRVDFFAVCHILSGNYGIVRMKHLPDSPNSIWVLIIDKLVCNVLLACQTFSLYESFFCMLVLEVGVIDLKELWRRIALSFPDIEYDHSPKVVRHHLPFTITENVYPQAG